MPCRSTPIGVDNKSLVQLVGSPEYCHPAARVLSRRYPFISLVVYPFSLCGLPHLLYIEPRAQAGLNKKPNLSETWNITTLSPISYHSCQPLISLISIDRFCSPFLSLLSQIHVQHRVTHKIIEQRERNWFPSSRCISNISIPSPPPPKENRPETYQKVKCFELYLEKTTFFIFCPETSILPKYLSILLPAMFLVLNMKTIFGLVLLYWILVYLIRLRLVMF